MFLNVSKLSFKLSRLFISNGLYDEMLRKEVIVYSSRQRITEALKSYRWPFSFKAENLPENEVSILDVLKGFINLLKDQDENYAMYFVPSLKKPEHFLMSVGEPMYEIVIEEVKVHR